MSKFSDDYKQGLIDHIKMMTYTGTIAFSAPEILRNEEYNENVDMWSAGAVLFTMLTGK